MKWKHENDYNVEIQDAAQKYMVDPAIIKGMIGQESQFVAKAYKFESLYGDDGKYRSQFAPRPDFPQGGGASYGLTQILDINARSMGFKGPLTDLFIPSVNLSYGVPFLRDVLNEATRRGLPLENALSAYNGGWRKSYGLAPAYGPFANQAYVTKVMGNIAYFQSAGNDAETIFSTGDVSGGGSEINLSTGLPYSVDDLPTTTQTASAAGILIAGAVALFFFMNRK